MIFSNNPVSATCVKVTSLSAPKFKTELSLLRDKSLTTNSAGAIIKLPVDEPVDNVVPNINLLSAGSAASFQPINAFLPVEPLSIIIPLSLVFADTPLLSSIILSVIVVFVDEIILLTLRSPLIVTDANTIL